MSELFGSRGRAPAARKTVVGNTNGKGSEPRDIAVSICAIAYGGGKNGGTYSAALASLPRELRLPARTIEEAIVAGESWGWLRRADGRVELTASGLYTAKLVLKLPT